MAVLDGEAETLKKNEDGAIFYRDLRGPVSGFVRAIKSQKRRKRWLKVENGDSGCPEEPDSGPESGSPSLAPLLQQALSRRLREVIGADQYSNFSHLHDWQAGLATGISPNLMRHRLLELRPRLTRPDSAMALVLNSFLPWLEQTDALELAGLGHFQELNFDTRCPTGVRGTPPHIELVASGPEGVVGATVQVFDYLAMRPSSLSAAYATLALPPSMSPWAALMRKAVSDPGEYRYVDIPALCKLAVGLGRIFVHRPVCLLYLFLEPDDVGQAPAFAGHRAELARLAELTGASAVTLVVSSFHELWTEWRIGSAPVALKAIATELCRRYAVAMPS